MAGNPIVEARGIGRIFGTVRALGGIDLALHPGEVLAVLGENGAGKSTLMRILAGVETADEGVLLIDGRETRFRGVADALAAGIALIHQELNLAPDLDIAGNVFLGREPRRLGMIDHAAMRRRTADLLEDLGLDAAPETPVSELSIGRRQQVEIARALAVNARVLIMDEPTSALSARETETLFALIARLKQRGTSIIHISHRLGEVMEIADRAVVLRDGRHAGTLGPGEITHEAMVRLMIGRELGEYYPRRTSTPGAVRLRVAELRTQAYPQHDVGLEIRAGEIVALAGLVGAGRSELLRALFGVDPRVAGRVEVDGTPVPPGSVRAAMAAGLALVPEERQAEGVLLEWAVEPNLSLAVLARDARGGIWTDRARERELAADMSTRLRIKANSTQQLSQLSGGNQQKVAIAKWLATGPRVILLDEPTRGVDIGARHEVYEWMEKLAEGGVAVLFASSDLTEVLGMADRVIVMHEGMIAGELPRHLADEESIMRLATAAPPSP